MANRKLEAVSDDPTRVRLRAALAWGAEGVRVDLFDHEGVRRYEWVLSWEDVARVVGPNTTSPVARANSDGVDFMAIDEGRNLLIARWGWDELVERAMVSASPVESKP